MRIISKAMWALLAALVLLWVGGGTPAEATNTPEVCYEQVDQAQYKKFTAPTDAGPWVLYGTWWKGQSGKWHADVGEVAEGPGNHPDGRYTYRRVAQRTVNGDVITCPTTTTSSTTTTVAETTTTFTMPPPLCLEGQPYQVDGAWFCPDPTTTTETPIVTGPATPPSTERLGDVCFQHLTGGPTLAVGDFVNYGYDRAPEATGSTNIGFAYCGPIVDTATPPTSTPAMTLPATGISNFALAVIALMCLMFGGSALWAARR